MESLVTAVVAIGSNLGDRAAHLDFAISRLQRLLGHLRVSRPKETAPVDMPESSGAFLNAAAVGVTALSARGLLDALLAIEQERGRERPYRNASRTLDLDVILFGDAVISEGGLSIPHPRFRERRFVLEPLVELVPDMRDPVTGLSMRELLGRIDNAVRERRR